MATRKSTEIHLKAYPKGAPTPDIFEAKTVDIADPGPGEVLVRQIWMSVDPYMRGRMRPDVKSYVPPFKTGEPLDGGAVGRVAASNNDNFKVGDYVVGMTGGWREWFLSDGAMLMKIDPDAAPLSAYLGVLGMPGLTAWAGVSQILKPKEGETMFVSGAAGAVGSLVCQIGKLKGCRVIGSAGSDEKCAWLKNDLGVDEAINYKTAGNMTKALAAAAPKGVDVYFENVGGEHLHAAIATIREQGRIALCGLISVYNEAEPKPEPINLFNILTRRVLMKGFIVSDHFDKLSEFIAEVGGWMKAGKISFRETVYEGVERAPDAFMGLFRGENTGKAVVRVGPDEGAA